MFAVTIDMLYDNIIRIFQPFKLNNGPCRKDKTNKELMFH